MALLPANFKTTNALGNVSVRYTNDQSKFAALKIFPAFMIPQAHYKWYKYDKQNLRDEGAYGLDAPSGTESRRFDYQVSTASGLAYEYASKHLVLGKDARDFDRPVADLRQDAALHNMEKLLINMETKMYTKISTAGNYASANTAAASAVWSGSSAAPIEDVRAAREAVFNSCGRRPNKMALNQKAFDYLKNVPEIVDRIKYVGMTNSDAVKKAIADLFDLEEIIVSDTQKMTSNEGATVAVSSIWGAVALVFYQGPSGLRSITFGNTFMVNNLSVKSLPRPELARGDLSAEEIETSWEWDQQFVAQDANGDTDCGFLLTSVY